MIKHFFIFLSILLSLSLTAQDNVYYQISLGDTPPKKALKLYKTKIQEIITSKLNDSKYLKQELLNNTFNSKKDSVSFKMTFWLHTNGQVHPSFFGSSLGRKTKSHQELRLLTSKIILHKNDINKVITKEINGKQIFIHFNYRKEKDLETKKVTFTSFKYHRKKTPSKNKDSLKTKKQAPPIYKGCKLPKEYNKKTNLILKKCMSKKINRIVSSEFNTTLLGKHPLLKGKIVQILSEFKINKQGHVTDIKALSILPELEIETKRVLKLIPNFKKPAIQDGKNVTVKFTKPITFRAD